MIVVTGATGQLGRLVIEALLKTVPANQLIAAVRSPDKAQDLAARGVTVRQADYTRPDTLDTAFAGATKILLISSNELGSRATQHQTVIDAAKRAGVKLLAYTSVLHADTSPLALAQEHVETEQYLRACGLPVVVLRNGWYTENYLAALPAALEHGVLLGSAGNGKIAAAARADYAQAAANVLAGGEHAGRIYELAGDTAFTLTQFAQAASDKSGRPVHYKDLPQAEYQAALQQAGFPQAFASLLADSDAGAAKGALFDDGHTLSRLAARATTPWETSLAHALKK